MKIGTKLGLGFGLIAFIIISLAAFSLIRMHGIVEVIEAQNKLRTEKLERLYVAREALGQTGLAARNAFIFTDKAQAARELDILDQQKAIYLDAVSAMTPLFKDDPDFEKVRKGLLAMAEELKRPRQFREADKMQEFGEFLVRECSPLRRQIVTDMDILLTSLQQVVETGSRDAEESLLQAEKIVFLFSVAALLASIAIGVFLTRGLLKQLGGEPADVGAIASRIAQGDLAAAVVTKPGDRTSMMHAMKEMRESLLNIVAEVRSGTDSIGTSSREIASGNQDLSARTEQQAASLEETASSMEELTSTVKQNADNARQANELARSASNVALKGGQVVSQVVDTMCSINESAKKIADIIGVIDGIAFQTNILALNAAVEAARAGEQGRGFAVVATEVRNLAQRSAAAAKEIKTLISDSVDKVETGGRLVAEAGSTMDEIVESVRRVTDIMADIAAASEEQTAGIEQVNQAIGHMDQATQQNAALVEQAAASAESLREQAGTLARLVSIFKLDAERNQAIHGSSTLPGSAKTVAPAARPIAAPAPARRLPSPAEKTTGGDWEEF
ncbi:MAG TPA: methyl-accepting chemotaxis protein [Noviherbaspirillum sp.]|uniref:methyl-accepting chemotaxis protein n=1 Tax=Noviherbaspirillum sp. TaxID=1926288 RepID=UPI002DDD0135|nr:methyl-accepting chemotaxis protein [Noviherbaspirillum sp.]HEV2609990.1 methyl-accepting chemotaxis protein [Noviherbaspirillum sp.]